MIIIILTMMELNTTLDGREEVNLFRILDVIMMMVIHNYVI